MIEITSREEFDAAIKGKSLIDFSAQWCGVCKMLEPFLKKSEKSLEKIDVKVYHIDVDKMDNLAEEFGIQFVPTVYLFVNEKNKANFVGMKTESAIMDFVKENI